jgi:ubiquinol-cytochrome c reductase cytochrome b subunit
MGFADGALRLLPGWLEFNIGGSTWSFNVMIGALLLIPVMYGLMAAYPFLERWVTGDTREHHLLDRPRNNPTRTALGMAALTTYGVLMFAAGNDLMAIKLGLSINDITHTLQAAFFIAPPIAFWVTKRICLSLQRRDRDLVLHGRETGRIIRTADGRFFEQHEPLDEFTRWNLVQHEPHEVLTLEAGTDQHGVASPLARTEKARSALSRFYFTDSINPVTPGELAAAHHDGHGHEAIEAAPSSESRPALESSRREPPKRP